jgi:purine catabolism regulator
MAITVAELASIPYLGLSLHAGSAGAERSVTWAHACDVPEATRWLAEGELLMTNGLNVPVSPDGQARFVRELADARLSGLAIGVGPHAPELSPELAETADELRFAVLLVPYSVPFVAISRAVANAGQRDEQRRLVRMVRIYDSVRLAALERCSGAELLRRLARDLGCELFCIELDHGAPLLPGSDQPPGPWCAALDGELRRHGGEFPALLRLCVDDATVVVTPLPGERPGALLVRARRGPLPELGVLQHIATIAALEVAKLVAEREQRRRAGAELLVQLLEAQLEPGRAARRLSEHGLPEQGLAVFAFDASVPAAGDLHQRLAEREITHLIARRDDATLVLAAASEQTTAVLREELGADMPVGVSRDLAQLVAIPDAAREARWALNAAHADGSGWVLYGSSGPRFLPRTAEEATAIVSDVIGPILAYDEAHGTQLLLSLEAFLARNRSWQRTATALAVHRQTVVYRMKRVEELTGRSLQDTGDVAELWMGLRARAIMRPGAPGAR